MDADRTRFQEFPTTSYMAQKLLGIKKQSKTYAVCPDCNKLFKMSDIISSTSSKNQQSGFKCDYVEFPNHSMKIQRKPCKTELLKKIPTVKGYIWRPKMVYTLPCLKIQLITMFRRPGFEELLSK